MSFNECLKPMNQGARESKPPRYSVFIQSRGKTKGRKSCGRHFFKTVLRDINFPLLENVKLDIYFQNIVETMSVRSLIDCREINI
jgi:hypothetical protein